MTVKEFARHHGVWTRTVWTWVKDGLPCTNGKKGSHDEKNLIDPLEGENWLAKKGLVTNQMRGAVAATALTSPEAEGSQPMVNLPLDDVAFDPVKAREEIDKSLLEKYGLEGALERLRWIERKVFANMLKLILEDGAAGAPLDETAMAKSVKRHAAIASLQSLQAKLTPILKDLEMAWLEFQKRRSILIDAREVKAIWCALCIGLKNTVMGIGNKTATFIRPYLQRPDDVNIVKNLIDDAARESLVTFDESKVPLPDADAIP
jgi:hypothetical protein